MFKIIIANNNDIFYNSLSNILLQNELNIELMKVPPNKLGKLICKIKPKDNVIILDSNTSLTFCRNVLKNAMENVDTKKVNIIIMVVDSNSISNIKYEYHYHFFKIRCRMFTQWTDKILGQFLSYILIATDGAAPYCLTVHSLPCIYRLGFYIFLIILIVCGWLFT